FITAEEYCQFDSIFSILTSGKAFNPLVDVCVLNDEKMFDLVFDIYKKVYVNEKQLKAVLNSKFTFSDKEEKRTLLTYLLESILSILNNTSQNEGEEEEDKIESILYIIMRLVDHNLFLTEDNLSLLEQIKDLDNADDYQELLELFQLKGIEA